MSIHSCYPERPSQEWSPSVFANGLNVERKGDILQPHGCNICAQHQGTHDGDHDVYAEGMAIQVKGDPMDGCASTCLGCSPDVTVD